jgi:hypothetical protein
VLRDAQAELFLVAAVVAALVLADVLAVAAVGALDAARQGHEVVLPRRRQLAVPGHLAPQAVESLGDALRARRARREGLPGLDRLRRALAVAESAAFAPEGFLRWANAARPKGSPEVTEIPLRVEELADALEELFRERVKWWCG